MYSGFDWPGAFNMLIIIIILLLVFGCGFAGYRTWGPGGGIGLGGLLLLILILYLLFGGGMGALHFR